MAKRKEPTETGGLFVTRSRSYFFGPGFGRGEGRQFISAPWIWWMFCGVLIRQDVHVRTTVT